MKCITLILTLGVASVISNPVASSNKPCSKSVTNSVKLEVPLHTEEPIEDSVVKEIEAIDNSGYDIPSNSEGTGNIEVILNTADNSLLKENEIINETEDYSTPVQNTEEIENADVTSNFVDSAPTIGDGVVDIVVEDNPVPSEDVNNTPFETIPEVQSTVNDGFSVANYLYRNVLQRRFANDLMASAKGFAPLPFLSLRRKQNPRRRFAIRRRYNRYPTRRLHSAYPYYAFYRPSSLRFY